jgi:hypothetical protein
MSRIQLQATKKRARDSRRMAETPSDGWGHFLSLGVPGKRLKIDCDAVSGFPIFYRPPKFRPACQRRRENVSAGRSKIASRMGAKCRTGRRFAARQTGSFDPQSAARPHAAMNGSGTPGSEIRPEILRMPQKSDRGQRIVARGKPGAINPGHGEGAARSGANGVDRPGCPPVRDDLRCGLMLVMLYKSARRWLRAGFPIVYR